MSRYNSFIASGTCRECGFEGALEYQADIGVLQWRQFKLGDDVFAGAADEKKSVVGPTTDLEALKSSSFWASGLAICPECGAENWGQVRIRNCRFVEVTAVESLEPEDWAIESFNPQ